MANVYDTIDRFYQSLNEKNWDELESLFTDEAIYSDPDFEVSGVALRTKEAIKRKFIGSMGMYTEYEVVVNNMTRNENQIMVDWSANGILRPQSSPTQREQEISFSGIDYFEIEDSGKIYHLRSTWDLSEHSYGSIQKV